MVFCLFLNCLYVVLCMVRAVPPIADASERCFLVAVHEPGLDGVHAALEAQHVLERVILKGRSFLISSLTAEQVFHKLLIGGHGKRPAPDRSEHFCRRIVGGDRDHRLHQSQLSIVRDCKEIALLPLPPSRIKITQVIYIST